MESLLEHYNTFLWIMAGTAVIVFIALQFFEAGYGYLFDRRYGPPVPNKVGWVLMESPVFFAMGDYQSARFGGILESSVVVRIAATAILYSHNEIEVMNHFVKKCCNNLFDRSCQCSCANVDFVSAAKF